ncbi:MAG TPA: winged helix-turn-helix domain-containing protein [Pseudolabrys sp.]|nr:winged helix-turn-helix domain-containing protein [Pseudolabrys sp.]
MPFPSFHTFFVPIVHALRARGGSATIDELEEAVASATNLSEEQRSQPHGDGPRTEFSYRLAWARTYLKKGGALDNSEKGVWHLTPAGYSMSDEEIRAIKAKVQQQNRDARAAAAALASSDETEEEEEDEIEDAVLTWKERLLETLLTMKPDSFDFARIWICQS